MENIIDKIEVYYNELNNKYVKVTSYLDKSKEPDIETLATPLEVETKIEHTIKTFPEIMVAYYD